MEITVDIHVGDDPAAVRIVLQVVQHPVHLVELTLRIFVFYPHLITICFADRSAFIRPTVPYVAVQIFYVI